MSTPIPHTAAGGVEYNVTLAELQETANYTHLTAHDVAEQLLTLQNYVIGLENAWQGIDANEFQDLMVVWNRYAVQLNEALHAIGDGMLGNYHNYGNNVATNHRNMASIKAGLPAANFG